MSTLLPFIFIGLSTGAVYGLAGVGLVLTYRTSGIFNFAHGALATVAAYLFYDTTVLHGWSPVWAAALAVLVLGPLLGLFLELIARRIQGATLAVQVAATVGLLLIVQAAALLHYGSIMPRVVPEYFPDGTVEVFGAFLSYANIVTFVVTAVAVLVLSLYLRYARRGIATLAVVDDPELLALAGTNPVTTRRLAWIIGSTLAAGSGVLLAPLVPLDPTRLTLLVVSAFGAAAIGMFRSMPITFVGGLGIGVLAALCTKWFTSGPLAGLAGAIPFIVLFAVLIAFPKRKLVARPQVIPRSHPSWRAPARFQLSLAAVVLVLLLAVPGFVGFSLIHWTSGLALTTVFLSLTLLVRMSGQVSLCHVTFMAIGAAGLSHLTQGQGLPWGLALLLSGLVAVPVGAVLAIPAIRLGGIYLALATFGFGVLVQSMFYTQDWFFGTQPGGVTVGRPTAGGLGDDKPFYYLVLGITLACALMVVGISRGRLGRLLGGMADSPSALETSGTTVNITRVLVFCLSAFLAAIGGALWSANLGSASIGDFPPLLSLQYFALVIILVGRTPWDALLAGLPLAVIPAYFQSESVTNIFTLVFGIGAVLYGLTATQEVDNSRLQSAIDRLARRKARVQEPVTADEREALLEQVRAPGGVFRAQDVRVTYGGVVAVDGVSIEVPTGQIIGLIGPNGAGKTTMFNACSGLISAASGEISMDDRGLSKLSVAGRARQGLGRTFQRMQLFDSLTVAQNVAFGAEGAMAGANPVRHILSRRSERRRMEVATEHALELCGLGDLRSAHVASLSTGQRRLVELARCLAGDFRILLLDEPSSGLDQAETKVFGDILRRVVRERNVGVLLVEHDMSLVLSICQNIYVIDFGKPIFTGTPREVATSPVVRSVYLGETDSSLVVEDDSRPLVELGSGEPS
ncbi:ATP-binding cassette domain-containing protein [Parafrankia sp. EUN1f]|uniref:ABC transporter permease subunit n=1 Tax=Parafrankia sp. EUN1f TaxID=102897 RepID=UPI0001C4421B|nr:ATP-binding cassette domain-containing protein [Parafrankia sp. EUN1f]EFC85771.1 ABC transporter related protein [Parafrankia sp. EUN1f]